MGKYKSFSSIIYLMLLSYSVFTLTHTTDHFLIFPYVLPLYFSLIVLFFIISCTLLDFFLSWKILLDCTLYPSSLLLSLFNHYYFSPSKPIPPFFFSLKQQHFSSCHFSLNFSSILATAISPWVCCSLAVIKAFFSPFPGNTEITDFSSETFQSKFLSQRM